MAKTECAICGKEVENLEVRNGEMMCEKCYEHPDNQIYTEEGDK